MAHSAAITDLPERRPQMSHSSRTRAAGGWLRPVTVCTRLRSSGDSGTPYAAASTALHAAHDDPPKTVPKSNGSVINAAMVIAVGVIRAAKWLTEYGYDIEALVAAGYREYDDVADKIFGNYFEVVRQQRGGNV